MTEIEFVAESGMIYLLVCAECDPECELPIPFGSPAERGRWAADHTSGTGHDNWVVRDQRQEIHHRDHRIGLHSLNEWTAPDDPAGWW